jgi:hypothetical protein
LKSNIFHAIRFQTHIKEVFMQMSNAPMTTGGATSVFQDWINALTKPSEQTFASMVSSPNAKATTAYLWVFVGLLVEFFFSALVQGVAIRQALEAQGVGGSNLPGGGLGVTVISAICGGPIGAAIGVLFFAIFTALVQWIAKMFGGKGTFDQMAYAFGAISAPFALVSAVFVLLGAIPFVGFCFRIIIGIAGLYALVLEIMAAKGVNQFDWGPAAGSVLIPIAALFLVCCCVIGGSFALLGASFKNVLQQRQQGSGSG